MKKIIVLAILFSASSLLCMDVAPHVEKKPKKPTVRKTTHKTRPKRKPAKRKLTDIEKIEYFKKTYTKKLVLNVNKKIQQKNQQYRKRSPKEQKSLPLKPLKKLLDCLGNLLRGFEHLEKNQKKKIKITSPRLTLQEKRAIVRAMGKDLSRTEANLIKDFVYRF